MRGWLPFSLALCVIAAAFGAALAVYPRIPAPSPAAVQAEAQPAPQPQPAPCFRIEALQRSLKDSLGERIVFSGLANSGVRVIVFMNEGGSWSLTDLDADGIACLIGFGDRGALVPIPAQAAKAPEEPA